MAQTDSRLYLSLIGVFLVLLVVMVLMLIFNNNKLEQALQDKGQLEGNLKQSQEQVRSHADKIRDLHKLIAGPNVGEDGAFPELSTYLNEELKGKAEKGINAALAELKETPRTFDALIQPYADIEGLLLKLLEGRDAAFKERATANDETATIKKAADATIAELRQQHEAKLQELQQLQTQFEDLDNKFKVEKAEWVKELEKNKDESSDKIIQLSRAGDFQKNTIRALENKIAKLLEETRKEKSFDEITPDGGIVDVLGDSGKAWINIGRVNHLRNGLVFRVFQYVKGEKKTFKGRVEVQKVDEATSEVRIIEEVDSLNPIVRGDFISSPFYDPKAQPVFVFAGSELESKDVSKDYLMAKMRTYGAEIKDKVEINTDFLVALKNFDGTPEYKSARELGVTIIRERDLLEFIGR